MAKKAKQTSAPKVVAPVPVVPPTDTDNYNEFHTVFQKRLEAIPPGTPLFLTEASGLLVLERDEAVGKTFGKGLFLENIDQAQRQHYTCRACSRFVERFGNLVTINPDGTTKAVFWDENEVPDFFKKAVKAIRLRVEKARVESNLVCVEKSWGQPVTTDKATWYHMAARPGSSRVFKETAKQTAGQAMAEMKQEHSMLLRGLNDFGLDLVTKAEALLTSGALYRAEKVIAQAKWVREQHELLAKATNKDNAAWLIAVSAPAGFCHIRSNMVGTLLQDIKDGLSTAEITKNFAERMDPLKYRRTTAAPSLGQVNAAEKVVAELGVVPSFNRRYVTTADYINEPGAVLWAPSVPRNPAPVTAPKASGVFDHLKPAKKAPDGSQVDIPAKLVTWEKFSRDVLPHVAVLEYRVPIVGPFAALTTAADRDAPPILQWDSIERRNPVAWSFPAAPPRAEEWNLRAGSLVLVNHVLAFPNAWYGNTRFESHGKGIFLALKGAFDQRALPGGGFFVEHLRGELAPYRSTVEAHVNKLVVSGAEVDATGFGIGLMAGTKWTELAAPKAVVAQGPLQATSGAAPKNVRAILVIDDSGSMGSYIYAARSAVDSLIASLRGMPGKVAVTVVLFGNHATTLVEDAPIDQAAGVTSQMCANSGGTALNDALSDAIERASSRPGANDEGTVFFLGIVTDGEENQSRRNTYATTRARVQQAQATGRWTIAFAGAGRDPLSYAREVGIPDGNATSFGASNEGFRDIGRRYASSTSGLGQSYASGQKASTSFFSAAASRKEIGTDHPVLVATMKDGGQAAFAFDRWE